jgi:hypothetical protein
LDLHFNNDDDLEKAKKVLPNFKGLIENPFIITKKKKKMK